ncbi:MAG: argininosuccinate lyase [Nitrospirae bacterium]|nr:argininosuccinate lyase [Nitrospirota bacterium]
MKKPWAGRFAEKTAKIVEAFTASVHFDKRLWRHDIEGSIAHAKMLGKQNIIPQKDANLIIKGLNEIKKEIESGKFKFSDELEDVHMNIEHALIKKIGPAGGRLHTARSRNDQVALDLRLYLRDELKEIISLIDNFREVLAALAEKYIDIIMPGYTHLQRAQPVLLSHHLLAYYEMLKRDEERFRNCLKITNVMPLGSAAMSGTTLPIDRKYTAKLLGFSEVSCNSMDAVADRDFVLEFLSASSVLMVHLSRLAEEFILWCSSEFGFIELPDAYSTGSSIMPQKKNPDVMELTRGKSGRVFGHLVSMLTIQKWLPLTYNRDMQEDKEPVFDTVDTVKACLSVIVSMMPKVKFNKTRMAKATEEGLLTATDLAEYLVKKGVPFRDAHEITGRAVRYCIENNKALTGLTLNEFKQFSNATDKDVFRCLKVNESINRKTSFGGTATKEVLRAIKQIKNEK